MRKFWKLLACSLLLCGMIAIAFCGIGCAASGGAPPTTQQVQAGAAEVQLLTNTIVVGLEDSGVIKGKSAIQASALQAAVTAASNSYANQIAAGQSVGNAILLSAPAGVLAYQNAIASPAPTP